MMLLVTPEDFQKLSPACKRELMALLNSQGAQSLEDDVPEYYVEDGSADEYLQQSDSSTIDDVLEEKTVVDITVLQARDLIAKSNLSKKSERSQQTLRLFAVGAPVALEELIGEGRPYSDFNDLKRSFVGAVNRRLRSVLRNRSAVLFSSDRKKTRIKITPLSAASLRKVLDVPEPIPTFEFFDNESRKCAPAYSENAKNLQERLHAAWQSFSGRPEPGGSSVDEATILQHFVDHGFIVSLGEPDALNDTSGNVEFSFYPTKEAPAQLLARRDDRGLVKFKLDEWSGAGYIFLSTTEVPGTIASLLT